MPTPVAAAAPALPGSIPLIPALPEVNPRVLEPEDIEDEGRAEEAFSNLSATAEALVDKCVKDDEDSSLRNRYILAFPLILYRYMHILVRQLLTNFAGALMK